MASREETDSPALSGVVSQPSINDSPIKAIPRVVLPTPSKLPLPKSPPSPLTLKEKILKAVNEGNDRSSNKNLPNGVHLNGIGNGTGATSTINGVQNGLNGAVSTGSTGQSTPQTTFPNLIFPPTTHQAYHTRNLLLHIYSMFNGAQAAIHQLGANCEFNQNLITFLSGQLVEKDRKIQTLTASVNMLQTAVQRAMRNNDDLKKSEEGLQEEVRALQKHAANGGKSNLRMEMEGELTNRIDKLVRELDGRANEKAKLIREHNEKLNDLEDEISGLKDNVELLEESLRCAVTIRYRHVAEIDNHVETSRNDDDRGEKMMNGRLEDTSISTSDDSSLLDEVNGIHTDGDVNGHQQTIFTDGASSVYGGTLPSRPLYLDSIMEEPDEEDKLDKENIINQFPVPPGSDIKEPIVPTTGGNKVLRATAKSFINELDFSYFDGENRLVTVRAETSNGLRDDGVFL